MPAAVSDGYRQYQRGLSRKAFGVVVAAAVGLFLFGLKAVARGLVLGTLFSVLNFAILAHSVPHQVGSSRKLAVVRSLSSIFVRFALLAVPIVMAIKLEMFNFAATVVGVFSIPLAIMVDHYLAQRRKVQGS